MSLLRDVLGISGKAVLATNSEGVTQHLRLVVEEDGTLKALTDQQYHEQVQGSEPMQAHQEQE